MIGCSGVPMRKRFDSRRQRDVACSLWRMTSGGCLEIMSDVALAM